MYAGDFLCPLDIVGNVAADRWGTDMLQRPLPQDVIAFPIISPLCILRICDLPDVDAVRLCNASSSHVSLLPCRHADRPDLYRACTFDHKIIQQKSDLPGIPCHTTVIPGIPGHFHDRLCLRCLPAGYSIITAGAVQILPNRRSNKCLRQDVLDVLRINPCQFICNRLQVICRPCAFPPVRFRCYPAFHTV